MYEKVLHYRTFQVVQWLRICLQMQVRSLVEALLIRSHVPQCNILCPVTKNQSSQKYIYKTSEHPKLIVYCVSYFTSDKYILMLQLKLDDFIDLISRAFVFIVCFYVPYFILFFFLWERVRGPLHRKRVWLWVVSRLRKTCGNSRTQT